MNGARETITKIWALPTEITLTFDGYDGAPDRKDLNPMLTYENQERCLARLDVVDYTRKEVVIALPESLLCHGLYRYDLHLFQQCCRPCDKTKIQFCGTCEITDARVSCNVG